MLYLYRRDTERSKLILMITSKLEKQVALLEKAGKIRTAETYRTSLNNFIRFLNDKSLRLEKLDASILRDYERWMQEERGLTRNSSSFYLRTLRACWHKTLDGRIPAVDPFAKVYTGVDKTVKRAIPLSALKRLRALPLTGERAWARDLFLFSFYTRGMAFIDMAFLRKADLHAGTLSYCRRKTGQRLAVRWEPCMQRIVDDWGPNPTAYLLPIVNRADRPMRAQYKNAIARANRLLHEIGMQLKLPIPLTMYVARHSWASIAHGLHVPLSVISEGLGHDSERTTSIYLAALDNRQIDDANLKILRELL